MQMQVTMKIIESQSQVIASELLKYLQKQFTVFLLQKNFVFGDGEKSISADSLFLSLSTRGGRWAIQTDKRGWRALFDHL